jgi:hypothetical protein
MNVAERSPETKTPENAGKWPEAKRFEDKKPEGK